MTASFIDSNVWLYRLLDDQRIEATERDRKRKIATSITDSPEIVISTQVINEVTVNLIKKASLNEEQVKSVIQSLYSRCRVIGFNSNILESASTFRTQYNFSFWDSLIVACAIYSSVTTLYSEDMQDGLVVGNKLIIVNPFESNP